MNNSISIIEKLNKYSANYSLDDCGLVNVDGNVDITYSNLKIFPINFGIVIGNFYCFNNKLITLKGGPKKVGGSFSCSFNSLTTLKGCPEKVGRDFYCDNNQLKDLEYCPISMGDDLLCINNPLEHLGHLLTCKIGGRIKTDLSLLKEFEKIKNTEIIFDND